MNDTTLQTPDAPAAAPLAAPPAPHPTAPRPAFADAEGASRWAKSLPLLNVAQAHDALHAQLCGLAAASLAPRERARIAEVLRELVNHVHTELARRYAGKPQPEGEREAEAIAQAIALWRALWEQYSACLKPLIEGDPDLQGVKQKVLQRGIYVGKQLVLVHGLARRATPEYVWQELHAYFRLAEMLDCAVASVTDELMPNGVGTSCYSTYSHALLLGLADPCAMSVRQIELTDRWLGQWARKMFPYARQRDADGPVVVVVDLDVPAGATLRCEAPPAPPASLRFGHPGKLATSIRGRLKRLAAGANPAELQLGHDVSVEQCVALLTHLDARWNRMADQATEVLGTSVEIVGGGTLAAYFRIGGRTFERNEPLATERTFHGTQHLKSLRALTHYDRFRDEADRDWPWERWDGRYEWRVAALAAVRSQYRWALEQLVVVRDAERTRLAFVSRVERDTAGRLALLLEIWPGAPKTLTLRSQSTGFAEEPPLPGVLLAEAPGERSTLVVPPRGFVPGRTFRAIDGGVERRFRLTRLLRRGADFEQVAFEES